MTGLRPYCRLLLLLGACVLSGVDADDMPSAERGFDLLTTKAYLPGDFDPAAFDALWAVWPEAERKEAEQASPAERRQLILERYGLFAAGGKSSLDRPPVGFVEAANRQWAMNCFTCHAGSVDGREPIYGLGNSHFAMHSLLSDLLAVKLRQFKGPTGLELSTQFLPLNATDGKTNAVVFGIAVGASRDRDLTVIPNQFDDYVHHDMDAPPWWNVRLKRTLYCDAYAPKTHRVIMPFVMSTRNDGPTVKSWEDDFRHVLAYLESLESPRYPFDTDEVAASRGRAIFEAKCASCHGTYDGEQEYPERVVEIDVVKTDRVRLDALTPEHRAWTEQGWLSRYGKDPVTTEPVGYLAPPLNGIWASAPYLHNGSVPTLWHLMRPDRRPVIWKRSHEGYDNRKVGVEFEAGEGVDDAASPAESRRFHDSSRFGMSNNGHEFFDGLTETELDELLEYLKTL